MRSSRLAHSPRSARPPLLLHASQAIPLHACVTLLPAQYANFVPECSEPHPTLKPGTGPLLSVSCGDRPSVEPSLQCPMDRLSGVEPRRVGLLLLQAIGRLSASTGCPLALLLWHLLSAGAGAHIPVLSSRETRNMAGWRQVAVPTLFTELQHCSVQVHQGKPMLVAVLVWSCVPAGSQNTGCVPPHSPPPLAACSGDVAACMHS